MKSKSLAALEIRVPTHARVHTHTHTRRFRLAQPKVANKQGLTPLHLALLGGGTVMEKCIALGSLLDAGADVNAQDNSGKTVLMEACEVCLSLETAPSCRPPFFSRKP